VLVFISFTIIFFATKYAFANLSYLKVDSYLTRWKMSNEVKQIELDDALASVDTMLMLHGHFPHYLNIAAKTYEWQAYLYSENEKIYRQSHLQALKYYQRSAALRMHWPITWVFMASVKSKLNQLDKDFYFYLEQAIQYGPYAHEVNLEVSKLQLLHWGNLPGLATKSGLEQIKRALVNNQSRLALLNYARDIKRIELVCTVAKLNKIKAASQYHLCR
jgi:hypothetical protein